MTLTLEPRRTQMAVHEINRAHLKRMTTDIGIWQHCRDDAPDKRHGYSIDDVARALIVAIGLWQARGRSGFRGASGPCLPRLHRAGERPDGRYHNFADAEGKWLDPLGSDDSFGAHGLGPRCRCER